MEHFSIIIGLTAIYFAIILGLVVYARIKETKSIMPGLNEFFLAGKNLHPLILTFTFVGSLFSTFSVLGMPGLAYAHGIGGPLFILFATWLGTILIYYLGRKLFKASRGQRVFSPIEIISKSYHSRRLGLLIALIFAILLIPYISLQLVAIGKFIVSYTDGQVSYMTGVGSMMAIVLAYLFLGGMRAVAYTDFIQTIAIFIGLLVGIFFVWHHFDIDLSALIKETRETSPKLLTIEGAQGAYPWPMFITSVIVFAGLWMQPHLLTRTMMASKKSDINCLVWGSLIGSALTVSLAILYGLSAHSIMGHDLKANLMMGDLFKIIGELNILGVILSGLMLMGALGAAMSTADSLLIAIGQISTRDMIRPFFKMSPKKQILMSKGIMMAVLVLAFVTGLEPPQFMTDLAIYSATGSAMMLPTFLFFKWKKKSKQAAFISIILSFALLFVLASYKAISGEDFLGVHVGFFPLVLSFCLYFGISFATYKKSKTKNKKKTTEALQSV